ncbi:hypothetical protein MRB53_039479 [Persea americana]|nr:hypothetical protein MRB53_039479 [Persea americana]
MTPTTPHEDIASANLASRLAISDRASPDAPVSTWSAHTANFDQPTQQTQAPALRAEVELPGSGSYGDRGTPTHAHRQNPKQPAFDVVSKAHTTDAAPAWDQSGHAPRDATIRGHNSAGRPPRPTRPSKQPSYHDARTYIGGGRDGSSDGASSLQAGTLPYSCGHTDQSAATTTQWPLLFHRHGMHRRHSSSHSTARTTTTSSPSRPPPYAHQHHAHRTSESLIDRYGGGLGYGWDRRLGFNGSAGTRSAPDSGTTVNRKSVLISNTYGLDLSDVPVFLRRNPLL